MWLRLFILSFVMACTSPVAAAEAPRSRVAELNQLFNRLGQAETPEETVRLQVQIEHVWIKGDGPTLDLLMSRALAAVESQNYDIALNLLNHMLKLAPDWAEAWNKRATIRYILNDDTGSLADIGRVLSLEPRHFGALAGEGAILTRQGKKAEALQAYRQALKISPQWADLKKLVERLSLESLKIWEQFEAFQLLLPIISAGLLAFTELRSSQISKANPPQGEFIAIAGGHLHLVDLRPVGHERGTILLLHGASGNLADMIGPLAPGLLAAGFRVIAPDRPGHGWSDRPDGQQDASPARQGEIIIEALNTMNIHTAIVVGHSWSGALATNMALDHKAFTQGLVLLSPVTHPWPGGIAWYYAPASSTLFGWLFTHTLTLPAGLMTMPAAIREVFSPQMPPDNFIEQTGVSLVLRPDEFRANAQDVEGLFDFVSMQSPRLGEITAPTAIIAGDSDRVVLTSIHSVQTQRQIAGSTLEIETNVGHSPHHSVPDKVVAAILAVAVRAGI
eukprot:gene6994-7063_t